MRAGSSRTIFTALLIVLMAAVSAMAYGQGGTTTSSLTGIVADSSGGVIPGADVVAKNNATGAVTQAVSDAEGSFTIPALQPGSYTVTISLMGFKTVTMPDVQVTAGTASSIKKAVLEVGQLQETVVVTGATEIVQTESAAVATTLTTKQITSVPLPTRNTLDFVASLPGVNTTTSIRSATVMGLQASATNITIDGINVQDNYLKSSDGFFARISPRMDAVEEVTVSTANPGAESAGQGAVQIRFVTRSGTNKFQGSVYEYMRRTQWNSNYWFNVRDGLPKDAVQVDTYGGRVGGPILKDKLFYFFNYEEFRQPGTQSRGRTVLTQDAVNGVFSYNGAPAPVDLYALAARFNQVATPDPTTADILKGVQAVLGQGTLLSTGNPITRTFNFFNGYTQLRRYPTTRLDYNVTSKHRVGLTYYLQQYRSTPDTLNNYDASYPGFPGTGGQNSDRYSWMGNWRWTISSNMVSEVRGGLTGGPVKFGDGITKDTYTNDFPWNGYAISTPLQTNTYRGVSPSLRDAPTYVLEDTISWIKGKHNINIGASFTQIDLNMTSYTAAPVISMGVDPLDPAYAMFTSTNFPGAAAADLTNARSLYALLTGRVTQISANANLDGSTGQYVYAGDYNQQAHQREAGFYIQDSWRIRPDLTLTGGLRYELQLPFVALNAAYSRPLDYCNTFGVSGCAADGISPNLFNPGVQNGTPTLFNAYTKGQKAYDTQYTNFAPSAGVAWRPHVNEGFVQKLLSADPVIRGGYSKTYTREGMAAVSGIYSYNPGGSVTATRNMSLGTLVGGTTGLALPLLIRNGFDQFGPPSFPSSPSYPLTPTTSNSVNEFYPGTETPYAHSFTLSFQRTITKNTAVDIRYIGTRMIGGWTIGGRNYNEYNVVENGFLNEFKLAQANLRANIAAGKGNTYAYTGAAGTSPLPIMLAWLNGSANAAATSSYTGSNWTNSTLYNYLNIQNPNPTSFATFLQTSNPTYANNAKAVGLAPNFFLVNPGQSSGGAYVSGNPADGRNSRYDSLQIELRRRMSSGLLVQGSYQYIARSEQTTNYSLRYPGQYVTAAAPTHSIKANWMYELPFGQGKKWGGGVSRTMNMLVGGWSWDGNLRIQSGNQIDFGNYRLIGMTDAELQSVYKLRYATDAAGKTRVFMLPQDIIDQSIKAFSFDSTTLDGYSKSLGAPTGAYFAPASGPDCINGYTGQCNGNAPLHHYVVGPAFFRADMSIAKRLDLTKRVWADIRMDVLNVFNNINYFGVTGAGSTTTSGYEVTSAYRDSSNTQDPGGRLIQLSFRVSF
jgi:hypothetical protein